MPRDEWQSNDPQSRFSRWSRQRGQREFGGWRGREFRGEEGGGQGAGYGEEWTQQGRLGRGFGGQRGWRGRSLGYDQDISGGRRWEGGGYGRQGAYRGFGREGGYGEEFPSSREQGGMWRGRSLRQRPWSAERGGAFGGGYGGYGGTYGGGYGGGYGAGYGEEFRGQGRQQGFGGGRERFGWRGRLRSRSRYGEEFGW